MDLGLESEGIMDGVDEGVGGVGGLFRFGDLDYIRSYRKVVGELIFVE